MQAKALVLAKKSLPLPPWEGLGEGGYPAFQPHSQKTWKRNHRHMNQTFIAQIPRSPKRRVVLKIL